MTETRPRRKRLTTRRATGAPVASSGVAGWIHQPHVPPVLDWVTSDEYVMPDGKTTLVAGTEFRVEGEGLTRFRFQRHVRRPNGAEWIDCISDHGFRAFRPERIRKVYRDKKSVEALAAVHKAKVKTRQSKIDERVVAVLELDDVDATRRARRAEASRKSRERRREAKSA